MRIGWSQLLSVALLLECAACSSEGEELDPAPRDAGGSDTVLEEPGVADAGDGLADSGTLDAQAMDGGHENRGPSCTCTSSVSAAAFSAVTLSGAGCVDPDGDPLAFSWSMIQRPPGSDAEILNAMSRDAVFVLDVATTPRTPYVVQLVAQDPAGLESSCTTEVHTISDPALLIQMTWDQAESDLDLHLLNPVGSEAPFDIGGWFNPVNDCYWFSTRPEWGLRGPADDPRLVRDDFDGFGPEIMEADALMAGSYTVGVHHFCDETRGPTLATVSIYCGGTLTASVSRVMEETGVFWQAATIEWPACRVVTSTLARAVSEGCRR